MLQTSCAKTKITPAGEFFPCYMCGHAIRTEKAKGIQDDLYTIATVLKINDETLIFVSVELIGFTAEGSDLLISYFSEKYNTPKDHVYISFVHTHSGPEYDVNGIFSKERTAIPGYLEWVEEQIKVNVAKCFEQGFTESKASFTVTSIDGFYGNRNGIDKPCDKDITRILFRDMNNKPVGCICNFTCHPTVLGPQNLYISPDLAGYLSRHIEEKLGCECMMMQGAAGDMSNRHYRQGNDQKELERTGNGIIDQLFADENWQDLNMDSVKIDRYHFERTFDKDLEKKKAQLKATEERLANAKNFDEKKVFTSALAHAKREVENFTPTFSMSMDCYYLQLGELSIFTMPAELFSRFGIMIKKAMGNKCNIFWGYNHSSVGYLYNKEDAGESFESIASDIPAGTTELIVDEICNFVKEKKK